MDNPLLNRFARQNRLNPNETNHDPLTRSLIDAVQQVYTKKDEDETGAPLTLKSNVRLLVSVVPVNNIFIK